MKRRVTVQLPAVVSEMAQEEILKQVAYLAQGISGARFTDGGRVLEFDAPEGASLDLGERAEALARQVQRSLRNVQRKVAFRSSAWDTLELRGTSYTAGIHLLGNGQVALEGLPLRLYRYFDRVFSDFGNRWRAQPLLTPVLIPSQALAKCDYFRSFPHHVTFACHMAEDPARVADFRSRHQERETLDDRALGDMATPEACLSPAVCYHVYHLNQHRTVPASGLVYGVQGRCFRYESSNMRDLRRLWDFTMREVVFLGTRDQVLRHREEGHEQMVRFLEEHRLAAEIRTASDPFFIAPDAVAKTYFQLSSETKYEISLALPDDERLAVGSLNYHTDFFGRAFHIMVEPTGYAHSVCIAFGIERWVHAFLAQHGDNPSRWPDVVRQAPEFAEV